MLENLKIKLIKMAIDAEEYNFCIENTGSFSIRDETSGYIIITPSKIKVENLSEEHICIVDLDGNNIQILEGIEASSDLQIHLEIYKARKEIRSIMHIQPSYTSAFAVVNKVIPPITYDAANYGGYIYVANYDKTDSNVFIKDLVEKLETSDACLLESNGAIIISKDVEEILSKAKYVEKVAETYYKALAINGYKEPKRYTREELMLYLGKQ